MGFIVPELVDSLFLGFVLVLVSWLKLQSILPFSSGPLVGAVRAGLSLPSHLLLRKQPRQLGGLLKVVGIAENIGQCWRFVLRTQCCSARAETARARASATPRPTSHSALQVCPIFLSQLQMNARPTLPSDLREIHWGFLFLFSAKLLLVPLFSLKAY